MFPEYEMMQVRAAALTKLEKIQMLHLQQLPGHKSESRFGAIRGKSKIEIQEIF